MESFWRTVGHRRTDGHCYQPHSDVVHVYLFSYPGLPYYCLHDPCFLDEHEAVYIGGKEKSVAVFVESDYTICLLVIYAGSSVKASIFISPPSLFQNRKQQIKGTPALVADS